jgi:hypothetical protein
MHAALAAIQIYEMYSTKPEELKERGTGFEFHQVGIDATLFAAVFTSQEVLHL